MPNDLKVLGLDIGTNSVGFCLDRLCHQGDSYGSQCFSKRGRGVGHKTRCSEESGETGFAIAAQNYRATFKAEVPPSQAANGIWALPPCGSGF